MNKKLITQIWNERYSNIALFLELVLISVLLWWIVDGFQSRWRATSQSIGYDISQTYLVTLDRFPDTHPLYNAMHQENEWKNIAGILERIRERSDVEAACMDLYSHPYPPRGSFDYVSYDTLSTFVFLRDIIVSPGFFRVFRIHGFHGETPDELERLLEQEGVMIGDQFLQREGIRLDDWPHKFVRFREDSTRNGRVLAVLETLRRDDYATPFRNNGFVLSKFQEPSATVIYTISLRVKVGQEEDFINRFWEDAPKHYRMGNVFVQEIESFSSIRARHLSTRYYGMHETKYFCVLFFLILNVFMALFGTFWFRTRQRYQEIALQVSMGSSRRQVFIRLISEGLFLLVFATFPALLIDYLLFNSGILSSYYNGGASCPFTPGRYWFSVGIAFLVMALTIVVSIWYPARYAMKISPAEALNEE